VSRPRLSRRGRWIRPLLMWNRLQGAEFFRASSPRSRYVVRSETPHQPRQSLTVLRGRQSGGIKHPNRRGTRDSPPPRMRRWLTDCRPSLVNRPTCNQMKGQAFRQGSRRPSKVKSSETPAVWRWAQRQDEETKVAISRDDVGVRRLPREQRSAIGTDSPATLPSRVDDRSPQGRKRTIMARYVFGDELKPGERWKRRLLTSR